MNGDRDWLKRAKETYRYHRAKMLENHAWTTAMTAKSLKRSVGAVCEDLLIARWLKTHGEIIEKFDYVYQAIQFIREKKIEEEMREIE